jgi:hypothetical protein
MKANEIKRNIKISLLSSVICGHACSHMAFREVSLFLYMNVVILRKWR